MKSWPPFRACILATLLVTFAGVLEHNNATAQNAETHPDRYQTVITKGLQYVGSAGKKWIDKRGCVSCHQVPSLIWSHELAFAHGTTAADIDLEDNDWEDWKSWSTNAVNFVKPAQKADVNLDEARAGNIDTMVALMLAIPKDSNATWRQEFVDSLVAEQAEDGSWRACGQLPMQRRPEQETHAVTTLWTTYALLNESVGFAEEAAISSADQVPRAQSSEWWAVRLLVADANDESNIDRFRKHLHDAQNDDGGWGWRLGQPSDALGTGYALYALAKTGDQSDAVEMAKQYLARTQQKSGSWKVPGTKKSAKGKPTETAIDWGSAWAVIALAESQR